MNFGEWIDYNNDVVILNPEDIKNSEAKLYGGFQLERMLSVFRNIVYIPREDDISLYSVRESATVAIKQKNVISDYAWVASHIVQKKIHELFIPLIEQLCKRAEHIMKRLADIGFSIMESRSNKKVGLRGGVVDDVQKMNGYSYFQSTVRDIFFEYVDKTAQICRDKCMNEIQCTQLIYWEVTSKLAVPDKVTPDSIQKFILNMSTQLFNDIRETITNNILLKCHNYFSVVMQRDVSGEILKDTSSFDDRLLEEMFELSTAKEQLKRDEEREKQNLKDYEDREKTLRDLSTQFARLKLVPNVF